jgi:hypothetical protein
MVKTRRDRWAELHKSLLWMDLTRYWPTLERCGAGRKRKDVYASTRDYNPLHHFIGVCGEFTYANAAGIPMNFAVDDTKGDGAVDFTIGTASVQVKTVPYYPAKWQRGVVALVEFVEFADMTRLDKLAEFYVLATVDLKRQRGAVIGWERAARLVRAPIVDLGYGARRALRAVDLQPGLPSFEDPLPANFREWQKQKHSTKSDDNGRSKEITGAG